MISFHEIFTRCSGRNTNLKYLDKIWLIVKYFASHDVMLTSYCAASTNWLVATSADRLAE